MELDATFWAFIALLIFFGIVIYFKVPGFVTKALDSRIARIEADLDEAKRLREEAQALLAEYERKRKAAEGEAEEIVAAAQEEAERMTAEAEAALEDMVARRTKAVEDKIAQAEAQALADVRARSADVAIEAARLILADQVKDNGGALVDQSIKDVANRLN
ncbi:F0F1 ATP synthase subunit B [Pelagibacterium halotolerans]|uniref:ATP synthase subunit b n=1 Tax=Pelagibacterium halotolerans (strain DSM 22347 / JCM 15775 / CGMCC 1.7692 / B2) TaxID=1082931 RepID=G4RB48_PELHB|nr:F0F1 ATP synthase subunit B [Pelagibacterium halotolerans]AEQ50557.1 ATP synthase B chain [Pelagibacterium halotolerans B2]QJR19494.1 ATP F0F1 synthase subunit B [Pelagibacterium halotolerans]SDZ89736.1 F-type H+-transporting ATPase subunit b [Pelagibacterium halotolerans]